MNSLPNNRKGQQLNIASIGVIALAIVVAIVVLSLGGTVLTKIQGTTTDTASAHPNDTFAFSNDTRQAFSQSRVIASSVIVYNASVKMNIGLNYTVTGDTITFLNNTGDEQMWCGVEDYSCINVSYSHYIGSEAYNTSNYGLMGTTTMAEFVPTIAIVAMAAIVIGVLLVMFGRRKEY